MEEHKTVTIELTHEGGSDEIELPMLMYAEIVLMAKMASVTVEEMFNNILKIAVLEDEGKQNDSRV